MEELTKTQKKVLQYLIRRQLKGLAFPTLGEMAEHFGIGSRAGMSGHLKALEKKNCLVRRKGQKRTADFLVPDNIIEAYGPSHNSSSASLSPRSTKVAGHFRADFHNDESDAIPLVARIAAGAPQEAYDQAGEYVKFNGRFFGSDSIQALEVDGDSMLGDGIFDGDLALIKPQNSLDKASDVVAVRVEGSGITLKRIRKVDQSIELIPSNPDFPTRYAAADAVEILGKLVGVVRRV